MIIKKSVLLAVLSVTAFSGWAQDNAPATATDSKDDSNTLMVTANRFPQPVSSVLAAATVVTREDIDRWQSKTLIDVMRRLPGVDIAQYGGMGQLSSVFIRGTNSNHTLILINGIRLNQAGVTGSSDLSQIPISLVQKIEYIRGPRSAVYGSDAIGGVINIITTRAQNGSTLAAGIGSNGYQSYDASTQQQLGDNTVGTFAGNYTYTKGYKVMSSESNPHDSQRDGFISKTLYGALQHQFNDQLSGFIRGYGFDNRTAYDATYLANGYALLDTQQLCSQTWDTGLDFQQGIYSTQLVGSYSHTKTYNYDPRYGQYDASATLDDIQQYNAQWGNTFEVGNGSISGGVDWQKQTTAPGTNYLSYGYEQRNTGVYATGRQLVGPVTLEGAVRSDHNSQFGQHATWQSSASWQFVDGYSVFASYGTAYKAPNLGQLYSDFYGNTNLRPEESKQWESGFEGLTGPITWRVSGYKNEITNLIQSDPNTFRYYNIGAANIKGVEATASFDTWDLSHHISYDYVDARDADTNAVLTRRAKQQLKYELDGNVADLGWALTYHYLGQRYDTDYNTYPAQTVKLGGVSLWDAALSYPVTKQLTVHGRIANLFDKDYETAYGYQNPGREYFLSGTYTF